MAKFLSTVTVDSKALEGVRFTIRKPSYQTRGLIDLETNEPRQQIAKLSREATKLMAERDRIKLPVPSESNPSPTLQDDPNWVELNGQVGELITQYLSVDQSKVGPVWFKRCPLRRAAQAPGTDE